MFSIRSGVWRSGLLASLMTSIAIAESALGAPADLATIQASLESLRQSAGITQIRYRGNVRIVQGSMNDLLDQPRPRGTGPDVPARDIVQATQNEIVRDFRRNRTWSKGCEAHVKITKDANGNEQVLPYLQFSESTSDGIEAISVSPKGKREQQSIPSGIRVPVEVYRFKLTENGQDPTIPHDLYPVYLSEGCLPSPDGPLTMRRYLPAFDAGKWRITQFAKIDGHDCPILVSLPTDSGHYDEYTLRPDLNYVPCRWVRYYKGHPTQVVTVEHEPLNGDRPRLMAWNIQTYRPAGVLFREETYRVDTIAHLNAIDEARFHLAPTDGMIVFDLNDTDYRIAGNEAVRFDTNFQANEFLDRSARAWKWIIWVAVGAVIVAIVGCGICWVRRRVNA